MRAQDKPTFETLLGELIAGQPQPVQDAARRLIAEIGIAEALKDSPARFQALADRRNLKIHLGSGGGFKPGWVNIDLKPYPGALPADTIYIPFDLRSGELPLKDGCADYIYSSHFFEHLECRDGARLMRDCYRLLQPGGVFRIALPDFKTSFKAYVEGDLTRFDLPQLASLMRESDPETRCIVDHINFGVYQNGDHKCIYDDEKIFLLLKRIGFSSVEASTYTAGIDPDKEIRRRYSFYMEAVK